MDKKNGLSMKYIASQVFYFAAFASMLGYASVYLLAKGFSNSMIGIILSLYSIIAVFLQPTLASFADQHKNIEIRKIVSIIVLIAIVLSALLLILPTNQIIIFILIVAIFSLMTSVMPFINTLAFVFEKYGININFGLARGLGSVAYAVTSLILGYVVEWMNADLLPLFYVLFNGLLLLAVYSFVLPKDAKLVETEEVEEKQEETNSLSLVAFSSKYKKYILFLLGFVLVYFAHTIINNFFIQIITNVGGTSSDMGIAVFLAAMLELPTMAYFNKMCEKVNCATLIKISIILFLVKHGITYLASNITMIYIAQVLQMGAYALFIPASVHYVNCKIASSDIVKGQSFLTTSMTMSGVFANFIGGILLDAVGVNEVLLIGVILSVIGAAIVILTTEKV